MQQLSQHELDTKIHGFLARKMDKFPELEDERHFIKRVPDSISKLSRMYAAPFIQLDGQY